MVSRSAAVSVPLRMHRFSISSAVKKVDSTPLTLRHLKPCPIRCTCATSASLIDSPPMLTARKNSRSAFNASCAARLCAIRAWSAAGSTGARNANCWRSVAISASRLSTSKRVSMSVIRSNNVCNLVALSTTCTGVVTLPQSCSSPAIFNSYRSLSLMVNAAIGPSVVRLTASASIMVSAGTRWQ